MSDHRLPTTIRPSRYDIHLTADPAQADFSGVVSIHCEVLAATDRIVLNAKGLDVTEALVEQGAAHIGSVETDLARERVTVQLAATLALGPAIVRLTYSGAVAKGMTGLYLSKDGNDVCIASQCEATDARAILPCFDEPALKAVFAWTVTAPRGMTVLTNGGLSSRRAAGPGATSGVTTEAETWTFMPTAPMSSYLVAVVIGAFKPGATISVGKVPFQVWALGGKEGLGDTGNNLAARLLPWFESYFGQPYAFGKYDQVAVPSFAFGAMENAGLVTFRPSLLLVEPAKASWDERKDVALVVAHEFAHMWFGNLVTMAWWDDLWLNEAFAEWMAHKAIAELHPELDVWTKFRSRAAGAMSTDALDSTHAIYHPIETPHEAAEMFDAVTYGKGSAVMRMMEAYLGPEAFRAGLRSYMAEFKFANAKGADLWSHLGKASGQDVGAIVSDWVRNVGHPAVSVSWDGSRLRLRQARARSSPGNPPATLWRIPLVIRYEDDAGTHTHRHLMTSREELLALPVKGKLRWLWPNGGDVGFYRSVPDVGLTTALRQAPLDNAERIAVLRDLWFELRAGNGEPEAFLTTFQHLADGEAPYDVLGRTVGMLRELEAILETVDDKPALDALRAWVASRLGPSYAHLGAQPKPNEQPATRKRRALLLRAVAGTARWKPAVADSRTLAAAERSGEPVDPDAAGTAVAVEAILGDAATLDAHLATYRSRRDAGAAPQLVERYLYVLPAFRPAPLVAKVLATLDSGDVAPQAVGPILRGLLVEPHSSRAAWAFLTMHWPRLKEKLGESWVAILVEASGEVPPALADEVRAFWAANLAGTAGQALGRAKERLEERAEFLARVAPAVSSWATGLAKALPAGPTR